MWLRKYLVRKILQEWDQENRGPWLINVVQRVGGAAHSWLPHLEVMFTHAMDSKRQASYTATVFIKRESSQLQPGHTSLFPISVNEWEYFILNGTWRIKVQPEGFNFVLWTSRQQLRLKKNSQDHVELTEQKAEWVFKSLHFSSLWKQMS